MDVKLDYLIFAGIWHFSLPKEAFSQIFLSLSNVYSLDTCPMHHQARGCGVKNIVIAHNDNVVLCNATLATHLP